jgi:hypothetical protein
MDLFGTGKKKEETSPNIPPPMGMPEQAPPDQYAQGYGQDYSQYPPQEAYAQQYPPGAEQPAQMGQQLPPQQFSPEINKEQIEEIAEAIVEEKWQDKKKEIDKIIEWKEETTTTLIQLKQQIDDLKASFDSLHKGMLGKISEYDENLTNVGTEIKAMEKVFSKVLPSMTDSVNKLQRMSSIKKK